MRFYEIMGIVTSLEIIHSMITRRRFEFQTGFVWFLYAIYKLFQMD